MKALVKYSYWIHSGKYILLQKFSVLFMGVASFMLLARMLGPSIFGVWSLFLVISSIAETARTAILKNAFIRYVHQSAENEHGQLQSSALLLNAFISVLLAVFFYLFSHSFSIWLNAPLLSIMLKWYAITLIVSISFSHFEMLLAAKVEFHGICWMYCIRQGLLVLVILFCYFFKVPISPAALAVLYLVCTFVGSITAFFFAKEYLKWDFDNSSKWISKLWNFGKYVFGNNISSLLFRSTDVFITSTWFGTAASAYYNACLRIGNLVDMPSQALGDMVFPKAAKYNNDDKTAIKKMYEKAVGATLVFSIPALLTILIFPHFILHFLAGRKFLVAASILRVTVFFGLILPFLKQFGTIMDATGNPSTNFKTMLFAFIMNLLTNVIGVSLFGIIGAAIGTATTYFTVFILTQIILYKKFGISIRGVLKSALQFYQTIFSHSFVFLKYQINIANFFKPKDQIASGLKNE